MKFDRLHFSFEDEKKWKQTRNSSLGNVFCPVFLDMKLFWLAIIYSSFFQGVLKTVSYRKQLRSFEGGQYQRADLGNGERIFSSAFLKLREVTLRVLDRFTCLWFLNEWGNNNLNWKEKGLTTHTKRQWPQKLVSTNRIIIGTFKTCGELKVLLNNITQFFVTLFLDIANQNQSSTARKTHRISVAPPPPP